MDIREVLTNTLYFAVGATALGIEKLSDAAKVLTEKGSVIVAQGMAEFKEYCEAAEAEQKKPTAVKPKQQDTEV